MTFLGADADALDATAVRITTAARRLAAVETEISTAVRTVSWLGPDADSFRRRWPTHAASIRSCTDVLTTLARSLARQSTQQRNASASRSGTSLVGGVAIAARARTLVSWSTGQPVPPSGFLASDDHPYLEGETPEGKSLDELAAEHAPIYRFDEDEDDWPMNPVTWGDDRAAGKKNDDHDPWTENNPTAADNLYYTVQPSPDGNGYVITYWTFYGYNDAPTITGYADHDGDWEYTAVWVGDDGNVVGVFTSHHGDATFTPVDEMEMNGNQPVVYVANGSHGTYPAPGDDYPTDAPVIDDVANGDYVPDGHDEPVGWDTSQLTPTNMIGTDEWTTDYGYEVTAPPSTLDGPIEELGDDWPVVETP